MDSTPTGSFGQYWSLSGGSLGMQASLFLLVVLLSVSLCFALIMLSGQQTRLRAARRLRQQPTTAMSIAALLYGKDNRLKIFQNIADVGMRAAAGYGGRLVERLSFSEWVGGCIERAIGREQRGLEKDIAILPVLGVIAPAVAIFIVLIILSTCVSRYTDITVLEPMAQSAAVARQALKDARTGTSANKANPNAEGEPLDFGKSHASFAPSLSSERSGPDHAALLDYNVQMSEIYLWLGQSFSVLIVGVFAFVSAFGGYLTIVARNKALEGYLRDFADDLMGVLLTSPPPRESEPDAVDEGTVVLVT